ncbi:hypothetical protein LSAT2_004768, partial [Lamellibrachia satsuma]
IWARPKRSMEAPNLPTPDRFSLVWARSEKLAPDALVVVLGAHNSVHLAFTQRSTDSCMKVVEVRSLVWWASGFRDISRYSVALRIAPCSSSRHTSLM